MSSASLQDIKARMRSVSSTMQITKAMELVASSKLKRAKDMALASRGFVSTLTEAISSLAPLSEVKESPWASPTADGPTLYIVIAGDRGLAGGYNSNIFRLTESIGTKEDFYLPVGKRACEYFARRGANIFATIPTVSDAGVGDAIRSGEAAAREYFEGRFSSVVIIYTQFVSMLTCRPVAEKILPLTSETSESAPDPVYEGEVEEILGRIIPTYVGGMLNTAILESSASEQSSRRSAMNSANKNASEIIDTLSVSYNRARQAAITQEITEIVSGAEALG